MSDLGHFGEYDKYLLLLGDAQRYKLRVNRHKGFLGDKPINFLLDKLKEEVIELEDAIARGNQIEMMLESADVANFALAIVIAVAKRNEDVRARVQGDVIGPQVECGQDDPNPVGS